MGDPKDNKVNTSDPKNKETSTNSTTQQPVTVGTTSASENNTVEQRITRPEPMLELILLFWVKERDNYSLRYTGNALFSESAQTRAQNIEKSSWYDSNIHKIHCPPIQAIHEIGTIINNWTTHYGGKDKIKTREIGVFSHGGHDGPISYQTAVDPYVVEDWPHQMAIPSGWDAIDFNWKEQNAMCVFYGCNTGANSSNGFAIRLSSLDNFKNVKVWGQSTYSYPSLYPDYRVTTLARSGSLPVSWDVGPTYMVGGNSGEGRKALQGHKDGVLNLSPEDLKKYPIANPMKAFIIGANIQTTHQGIFNDHRKVN